MGEARRRKKALGFAYGTPESSNHPLIAYQGFTQKELDSKALQHIQAALAKGQHVTLIGTQAARPLAEAANLPWLHELPKGDPIPESVAWDVEIAANGGPILHQSDRPDGGIVILGAGSSQWLEEAIAGHQPYIK
jgi:hypothetical protein